MPQEILIDLNKTNVEYEEVENIEDIIDDVEVMVCHQNSKGTFCRH